MHRERTWRLVAVAGAVGLAGLSAPQAARAAQSYDNCTGFIDSIPATISSQGVWCLRQHLSTAVTSGAAITIAANNVTIDCNDFRVGGLAAGSGSLAYGIHADTRQNVTIRNCNIRGFYEGIRLNGGNGGGHLVEDNRLDNNLRIGILVHGVGNLITRNRVVDTGGAASSSTYGIFARGNIVDNDIVGLIGRSDGSGWVYGIDMGASGSGPAIAQGNRISRLTPTGGGTASGIFGYANGGMATGNIVIAGTGTVSGTGIFSLTACTHNVVAYFSTAYATCAGTGNHPQWPAP